MIIWAGDVASKVRTLRSAAFKHGGDSPPAFVFVIRKTVEGCTSNCPIKHTAKYASMLKHSVKLTTMTVSTENKEKTEHCPLPTKIRARQRTHFLEVGKIVPCHQRSSTGGGSNGADSRRGGTRRDERGAGGEPSHLLSQDFALSERCDRLDGCGSKSECRTDVIGVVEPVNSIDIKINR